jgi:hypothetical protein
MGMAQEEFSNKIWHMLHLSEGNIQNFTLTYKVGKETTLDVSYTFPEKLQTFSDFIETVTEANGNCKNG